MLRSCATVLMILGLIIQPLNAAVPDYITVHDQSSPPASHHSDAAGEHAPEHLAVNAEQASGASCHEDSSQTMQSELCKDCEGDCATGGCASACQMSTVALLDHAAAVTYHLFCTPVAIARELSPQGIPSSIFHPPKHA